MAETNRLYVTSRIRSTLTEQSVIGKVVVGSSPVSLTVVLQSLKTKVLNLVSKLRPVEM